MNIQPIYAILIGAAIVLGLPIIVGLIAAYFVGIPVGALAGFILFLVILFLGHRYMVKIRKDNRGGK